jgi:nucleotide-binding universal stress UspA family protein
VEAAAGADLLVVGSRGHGALAGALIGSVSQQCLHHAPCPLAIVHVAHYAQHGRIVVGVDASPGSDIALAWAVGEARLRDAGLHALAAYFEPWGVAAGGLSNPQAVVELRHSLEQQAKQALEHARGRVPDEVGMATEAVHAPAADALISAAADADLLVVGSRGRGGFKSLLLGSVSQHCANLAPGTVIVVPSKDDGR